jgi:hypothetical protein
VTSEELAEIVRRAAASAKRRETFEDDRVELKGQWPEPLHQLARQLGAQANARRGQEFVWLIGIREKQGVVGAPARDGADWLPSLRRSFDQGVMPKLSGHENFEIDGKNVVALLWEPNEPPYVITRGPKGEKVFAYVPWREGESVRTADRKELFQILEPMALVPALEFVPGPILQHVGASLFDGIEGLQWSLRCSVRVTPRSSKPVVIPYGGTTCRLIAEDTGDVVELRLLMHTNEGETSYRETGSGEVTFSAPATIGLIAPTLQNPLPLIERPKRIRSEIMFRAVGARAPATLAIYWQEPASIPEGWWGYWRPETME